MKKAHYIALALLTLVGCTKPSDIDDPAKDDPQTEQPGNQEQEKPAPPSTDTGDYWCDRDDFTGKQLPTVKITVGGKTIEKGVYTAGTIVFEDPDGMYSSVKELSCPMRIKGRGNTSWDQPKKPYKIKLDEGAKVFGLHKDKDWVLIANYSDKTLLRNLVGFKVSRIVEMEWTPAGRSVEVYMDNKYLGVYTLQEHKETNKDKVVADIVTETSTDITGDYYLEMNVAMDADFNFKSEYMAFSAVEPEIPTAAQQKYLQNYINEAEKAIMGSKQGYKDYLDADSWIRFFIIEELAKNIDGNSRKSSFVLKRKNGPFSVVNVWDFDLAFGNANYFTDFGESNGPEGWYVKIYGYRHYQKNDGWINKMFQDPEFTARAKELWQKYYPALLEEVPAYIEREAARIGDEAYARNFNTWRILGTYVWPNVYYGKTVREDIDYMKKYYLDRLDWMNSQISKW